jgi:Ca2+-binding RTX toxin-like protein
MRAFLLAVLVALLPAAPATAGVVTASSGTGYKGDSLANFGFAAAPGEANRLRIAITDTRMTVVDDAAPIVARGDCRSESDHAAVCSLYMDPSLSRLHHVVLGDGDDRVELSSTGSSFTSVDLGAGDDAFAGQAGSVDGAEGADTLVADAFSTMSGGPGADRLQGSAGPDALYGGPGADVIAAGAGADVVGVADGEPDVVDGGEGRDRLSYAGASTPVSADLADAVPEGQPGEDDRATGFEDLEGGVGDDVLGGDAGDNRLVGGLGSDRLAGRGGDDVLAGAWVDPEASLTSARGVDVLDGGTGDDRLEVAGGPSTDASCGPGRDVVRLARDALVRSTADCERFRLARRSGDGTVRALGGGRVAVRCPAGSTRPARRCHVAATARRAGQALGTARATTRPGGIARLALGRRARGRVLLELVIGQTRSRTFRARLGLTLPR